MSSPFARYKVRTTHYSPRAHATNVLPIPRNALAQPKVDKKFRNYHDATKDMRDKENIEMSEAMRHPRERDFYQDHTYHNGWVQRDLDAKQRKQLLQMFSHYHPGHEIAPWVWYPGDIVEVTDGEFAGMRGSIMTVVKWKNEIMVQNVNVQDITVPASESRPEHVMQREHPISVRSVKHVDPSTNELCDVRLVTVRDKETGAKVQKRISMASGVLMPIPEREATLDSDPLHDTPLEDAEAETYDAERELGIMVQRKLRAMEDYFVGRLAAAHQKHAPATEAVHAEVRRYQSDVAQRATDLLVAQYAAGSVGADAPAFRAELAAVCSDAAHQARQPSEWWFEGVELPEADMEPMEEEEE